MILLSYILGGLAMFAREGWTGGPYRAPLMPLRSLVDLAIVHFCAIFTIGLVMCALATVSALVLRSIL